MSKIIKNSYFKNPKTVFINNNVDMSQDARDLKNALGDRYISSYEDGKLNNLNRPYQLVGYPDIDGEIHAELLAQTTHLSKKQLKSSDFENIRDDQYVCKKSVVFKSKTGNGKDMIDYFKKGKADIEMHVSKFVMTNEVNSYLTDLKTGDRGLNVKGIKSYKAYKLSKASKNSLVDHGKVKSILGLENTNSKKISTETSKKILDSVKEATGDMLTDS